MKVTTTPATRTTITTHAFSFLVAFIFLVIAADTTCHAAAASDYHNHYASSPFGRSVTKGLAFANSGGFGGSTPKSSRNNKKKKRKKKQNPSQMAATTASNKSFLTTAQGRMQHIQERIKVADLSPITRLALITKDNDNVELDVDPNGIAVIDNFLGTEVIRAMRSEAEGLKHTMVPSQSTKWDEASQTVVPYQKKGVLSTQIEGGTEGYKASPILVEYIVALTNHLSQKLNRDLPDAHWLSNQEQTNKLAVCLGDGSFYDKHIDNLGGGGARDSVAGDPRKLTALLYLQPPGSHDAVLKSDYPNEKIDEDPRGGFFRAYDVPSQGDVTCIAPRGDRLVLFWSDSLVHDVSPSFADTNGDQRWALTTWLVLKDKSKGKIRETDPETERRHFGKGIGTG